MKIQTVNFNKPANDHERFIVDLVKALDQETIRYLDRIAGNKFSLHDLLMIRDAAIGYACHMIHVICREMRDKDNQKYIPEFLDDSLEMFKRNIDQIRKTE